MIKLNTVYEVLSHKYVPINGCCGHYYYVVVIVNHDSEGRITLSFRIFVLTDKFIQNDEENVKDRLPRKYCNSLFFKGRQFINISQYF